MAGWALYSLLPGEPGMKPPPPPAIDLPDCDDRALDAANRIFAPAAATTKKAESGPAGPSGGIRLAILLAPILAACVLFVVAGVQDSKEAVGFDFEEYILTRRWPFVLAFVVLGFAASAYRQRLSFVGTQTFNALSNETNSSLLWPVQAALAVALFVGVLLAINPRLVEKMTTFKAGGVEADFAAGTAKLAAAPVQLLDVSQQTSLSHWVDFKIIDIEGWERPSDYHGSNPPSYRETMYRLSGVDYGRTNWAQSIFDRQLLPLFTVIKCFDDAGEIEEVRNNEALLAYAKSFSNIIKLDIDNGIDNEKLENAIWSLDARSRSSVKSLRRKYEEHISLTTNCPKPLGDDLYPGFDRSDIYKTMPSRDSTADPPSQRWDLYVLSAVADLIGFIENQRSRAAFLEHIRNAGPRNFVRCNDDKCRFVAPSITSFVYALNEAKLKSAATWPVDESVADMRSALADIDMILASKDLMKPEIVPGEIEEVLTSYRVNKLDDLTLALEIFNQRALAGR